MNIKKKEWLHLSSEDKEQLVEDVFAYYRNSGFPFYPIDTEYRTKEFNKLQGYDYKKCIDFQNKRILQSMHGLGLAWSYFPHSFSVPCNGMLTPMQLFQDNNLFRQVIRKRMRMGDNISDSGIRKMLKMFTGAQGVSNFRPTAAAAIYEVFSEQNDTVYDMSCGFGGRLLGAAISSRKYIGVDPSKKTFDGLIAMRNQLNIIDAEIYNLGSEVYLPEKDSLDLCFTSPPYFDTEKYADEETQSYMKFSTIDSWINGFLTDTVKNCYIGLKSGKKLVINIADTKKVKNLVDMTILTCINNGFRHVDTWQYSLSSFSGNKYKYEPILVFEK